MVKYYELDEALYEAIDLTAAIAGHSADKTVAYKEVDGTPIYMGYYFPEEYDPVKKYPVFVMVHGGAWGGHMIFPEQSHWQGDYLGFLARYYSLRGFVAVSLDYRMAREFGQLPEYGIMECYEDCCDAMDYLLETAEQYGIDKDRMYLLGESAGGHLAGLLATFHYDRSYHFEKTFLINPITYLDDDKWGNYVPVHSIHPCLKNLSLLQRKRFLSPLYQADKNTGEVIFLHGTEDSAVDPEHSRRFYERMQQIGGKGELHLITDSHHAFLIAEYSKEKTACKIGITILNQSLIYGARN